MYLPRGSGSGRQGRYRPISPRSRVTKLTVHGKGWESVELAILYQAYADATILEGVAMTVRIL